MSMASTDSTLVDEFEIVALEIVGLAAFVFILFVSFAWAITRAGKLPHPGSLITSLSLLTFMALLGFIATQAESLVALASAGVGAIAGAVTSTFKGNGDNGPPDDK